MVFIFLNEGAFLARKHSKRHERMDFSDSFSRTKRLRAVLAILLVQKNRQVNWLR